MRAVHLLGQKNTIVPAHRGNVPRHAVMRRFGWKGCLLLLRIRPGSRDPPFFSFFSFPHPATVLTRVRPRSKSHIHKYLSLLRSRLKAKRHLVARGWRAFQGYHRAASGQDCAARRGRQHGGAQRCAALHRPLRGECLAGAERGAEPLALARLELRAKVLRLARRGVA